MSLFVIGDLHLSLSENKPMDVFSGWEGYVDKLKFNWIERITDDDTIILLGDISWAMNLDGAFMDFQFINSLPGKKIIIKGNHDYWWTTKNKMDNFFLENNFHTLNILNNNCYSYNNIGICGSRGWINETNEEVSSKVLKRESIRLSASIESAIKLGLTPVVFIHYPPIYGSSYNYEILDVLFKYNIKYCFYGHLHGNSCNYAINGERDGIQYRLVSSDYIQFCPLDISYIL